MPSIQSLRYHADKAPKTLRRQVCDDRDARGVPWRDQRAGNERAYKNGPRPPAQGRCGAQARQTFMPAKKPARAHPPRAAFTISRESGRSGKSEARKIKPSRPSRLQVLPVRPNSPHEPRRVRATAPAGGMEARLMREVCALRSHRRSAGDVLSSCRLAQDNGGIREPASGFQPHHRSRHDHWNTPVFSDVQATSPQRVLAEMPTTRSALSAFWATSRRPRAGALTMEWRRQDARVARALPRRIQESVTALC